LKVGHAQQSRLQPLKRGHPHPEAENQSSDEKTEAELHSISRETQHKAEDNEGFKECGNSQDLRLTDH